MGSYDANSMFADQFEADGKGGYLYRKSLRGPAIRVSTAERDAFIDQFVRSHRFLQRALAASVLVAILVLVSASQWLGRNLTDSAIFPLTCAAVGIFLLVWHRIWNAPAAALEWRTPVSRALSRAEARQLVVRRTSWLHLGLCALLVPFSILHAMSARDPFAHWLWIAFATLMIVGLPLQAFRKWRVDRITDEPIR
jgi:hypothetical protein